ncbi:phosphopantothenoylcysteine decarboxylase [Cerasicoccus fimbriatus]|uniref:phosphopantothenoylcysteine decarboxylase domain-containing protein n=1 Tax=Cerasicoccus fimbriatus TaxID=3014554 RepID=UPI0022B3A443|nr:phosphopantothenoylcysteine decarboxylase [Cerasicoccus sp. TK19100]
MSDARPIRCLITAGPTREWLDPVRFITNPSSGKMGYAIAEAARALGWTVELVSGPVALAAPEDVELEKVVTGEEMLAAVQRRFPKCDVLIKTAAVCDMRPKQAAAHKVKKDAISWTVEFEPTPDILKTVAATKQPGQVVVGFAAETQDVENYARKKLAAKNLDFICANSVAAGGAFESDHNEIALIGKDGSLVRIGPASKTDVARELIAQLAPHLATRA